MSIKPERLRLVAFMGALSLFLATIEYLFPKPLPFFRLGLSNLPLLIMLDFLTARELGLLLLLKVLGQGIVNGTLASYVFVFSLAGSLASFAVMLGLQTWVSRRHLSLIGISTAGALASNAVQIGLSIVWIYGPTAWVIAPLLLGLGTASGAVLGWGGEIFCQRSRWLGRVKHGH